MAPNKHTLEWLANDCERQKVATIGAFLVDDLIGMDDSLTKDIPGYSQLGIEDEYEQLVDKQKIKDMACWYNTIR